MSSWFLFVLIFAINCYQSNTEIVSCNGACLCDATVQGETCTLDCVAKQASCRGATLTCRDGDPCIINCQKRRACQATTIICPDNSDCTIYCTDPADTCDGNSRGSFNVVLGNQTKNYQCIDGIAPGETGVCPLLTHMYLLHSQVHQPRQFPRLHPQQGIINMQ
eukprot:147234_1